MAGHVLSNIQEQKERQTQAMQEMAWGGGAYDGGFAGYGAATAGRHMGLPRNTEHQWDAGKEGEG